MGRWGQGFFEDDLALDIEGAFDDAVAGGQAPAAAAAGLLDRVGHDLWSWDHDGDSELWGNDYMRAAPGQGLRLQVRYRPDLEVGLGFGELSVGLDEEG